MPEERHFGRSLLLVDGDIAFEQVAGKSRLLEVAGRPNLTQALELRVLTPLGSDRFNILYGLDYAQIFGSEEGLRMTKELIKLNLVRTLATDARIADVREIRFQDEEEYAAAHPEISDAELREDRVRRRWEVEVLLETTEAGDVAVRPGIGS
jgi:hypothetical protein